MVNLFQLLILISALIGNLLLGLTTYLKNPKSITNKIFFTFTFILSAYLLINYFSLNSTNPQLVLFLIRLVMGIALLINVSFFLFISVFPQNKITMNKFMFWAFIIITVLLLIPVIFSPFIFQTVIMKNGNIETLPGVGMPVFLLHTLLFLGAGFVNLIRKYRKSVGIQKIQLRLLLLGTIFMFLAIIILNFVLVVVFNISSFVNLLPIYTLIFIGFISYAIIRHKFLDISLIIARAVSYTLLSFILIILYTVFTYSVSYLFRQEKISMDRILFSSMVAIILVYTYPTLKRLLEKNSDKIFYKGHYDSQTILTDLTKIMASTLDLDKLLRKLNNTIIKNLRVVDSYFVLKNKDNKIIIHGIEYQNIDLETVSQHKTVLVREETKIRKIVDLMNQLQFSAIVPLYTEKSGFLGFFGIGNKQSGEIINNQDIKFLEIFGKEVSIALENAKAYKEIKQFSKTLQIKVEEATQKLQEANGKLKELDKRKDEFLNVSAHEMRAPLTAVKGYLSMLSEDKAMQKHKQLQAFLDGALEGAEREIRLVNNMLNLSRIEEGRLVYQMGLVKLSQVAQFTYDEFKAEAEAKRLTFRLNINKEIKDKVYVDQDRIHEITTNLVSNAIKYTDEGSVIINVTNPDKDNVEFEVVDTGFGMNKDEQQKLFTKFYRAESSAGKKMGTGLGLYITRLLIEKFGGKISFESERGKGSTFSFILPLRRK
ncbi:hypothetical protein GYA19_00165 [Candidatus Beckwithbacteria bacterium]|nr:hypothetical protein [Candidatus Beckwithbacteria bacterium]